MAVNGRLLARRMTLTRSRSLPKESVVLHWRDYCGSTSIHGVKYFVEPRRPAIERIWWTLVLTVCLTWNVYVMRDMWHTYNKGPPAPVKLLDIPFPAITICNDMKVKKSVFDKLNQTDEGNHRLGTLDSILELADLDVDDIGGGYDNLNSSDIEFLIRATTSLDEMTRECVFEILGDSDLDEHEMCAFLFTQFITDLGVCFTFNALSVQDLFRGYVNPWNKDNGRLSNWTSDRIENNDYFDEIRPPYPYRTFGAGKLFGISVELKVLRSDVMMSRWGETMVGFKVLLHNPQDFPLMGQPPIHVPPNREVTVMIEPKISTTSNGLRSYEPDLRHCYYSHEKKLAHFKIYSEKNCELECLVNFTLATCNCVGLHMPRNETTPICPPTDRTCIVEAEITLAAELHELANCGCLPSCNWIEYSSVARQSDFRSKAWMELNQTGFDGSKLVVFFRDTKFQVNERPEVVSFVDFLASCGGLLGLFSGMSLISFCEIFYYLTFRLWANIRSVKQSVEPVGVEVSSAPQKIPPAVNSVRAPVPEDSNECIPNNTKATNKEILFSKIEGSR